ncbi:glycosyl transferase family 1, partial [Mycobacterium tuberculosis]
YLPSDAVVMLPEEFSDEALIKALEDLRQSPATARALGEKGKELISTTHAPADCAQQYAEAIELFASRAQYARSGLIKSIAADTSLSDDGLAEAAQGIARALPMPAAKRQLFVD